MGIFEKLFNTESAHFKTIDRPTFIKGFTKESENLNALEALSEAVKDEDKNEQINRELILMKMGINGENTVSKQLLGNVNINSDGEFIRVYKGKNGFETKTGMYSPIEQNRKHINLLKRLIKDKFGFDHVPIKSLVVMANPKAIIRKSYAPQDIQDQIIRAEQLGEHLKGWMESIETVYLKEETAFKIANFIKDENKPIAIDYKGKFGLTNINNSESVEVSANVDEDMPEESIHEDIIKAEENEVLDDNDKSLVDKLKQYRNTKAKEQGLEYFKYHFVFSNSVILSLVKEKPKAIDQLHSIKGLGEHKIGSYGSDILSIINQHNKDTIINNETNASVISGDDGIREKLRQYRLETARKENIKAYVIFNNEQMEEIISVKPRTRQDLLKIKGFGEIKVEKYGDGILEVMRK